MINYFLESRRPPPPVAVESVNATNFEFPEMILNVKLEQQDQDMLDTSDVLEMDDSFAADFGHSVDDDDFRAASSDDHATSNKHIKEDESEFVGINELERPCFQSSAVFEVVQNFL